MNTPQLIELIRAVSALEDRGDGIGRPLDEQTKASVSAFRNAMIRRLITCHLSGADHSIDTEGLINLNDALLTLEQEGDGYIVGLSQDDQRLSGELRAALIERVRLHPGGAMIAKLMSRLGPVPAVATPAPKAEAGPPAPDARKPQAPAPQPGAEAGTSVAVVPGATSSFNLADDGALRYAPGATSGEAAARPRKPVAA